MTIRTDFKIGDEVTAVNAKFNYSIKAVILDKINIGGTIYFKITEKGKESKGFWIKQYPHPYGWIIKGDENDS